MPKPPSNREPDPMARVVDRLLAQLPGLQGGHQPLPGSAREPSFETPAAWSSPSSQDAGTPGLLGLCARLLLAVVLSVMMVAWPYSRVCGLPLYAYAGAVGMVILAGAWAGTIAWKAQVALAHIVAIILVFWGLVLAAEVVLPRIGYAGQMAEWRCEEVPLFDPAVTFENPKPTVPPAS